MTPTLKRESWADSNMSSASIRSTTGSRSLSIRPAMRASWGIEARLRGLICSWNGSRTGWRPLMKSCKQWAVTKQTRVNWRFWPKVWIPIDLRPYSETWGPLWRIQCKELSRGKNWTKWNWSIDMSSCYKRRDSSSRLWTRNTLRRLSTKSTQSKKTWIESHLNRVTCKLN